MGGFVRAAIRRGPKLIAERRVYLCFGVAGGLLYYGADLAASYRRVACHDPQKKR
jgi:hypothetical protein